MDTRRPSTDFGLRLTRPEGHRAEEFHLSRRGLGLSGLFFLGFSAAAGTVQASALTTTEDGLITEHLTLPTLTAEGDYKIPAYIARPQGQGPHPVVLVVSEVFGVHDYIRDVCRRLAHEGYCALALDHFARAGNAAAAQGWDEVRRIVEATTLATVLSDLEAGLNWLTAQAFADTTRVGITGYCWGGAVVWMAAALLPQIDCGVAWYGRLARPASGDFLGAEDRQWPLDVAPNLTKPVLGLYGGKDGGIPLETVEAMQTALSSGASGSRIIVYPEAQHGFHADYRPSYDEAAAKAGWAEALNWFNARLL